MITFIGIRNVIYLVTVLVATSQMVLLFRIIQTKNSHMDPDVGELAKRYHVNILCLPSNETTKNYQSEQNTRFR